MVDSHYLYLCIIAFTGFSTILIHHLKYYKKGLYKFVFVFLISACLNFVCLDFVWALCSLDIIKSDVIYFWITTLYYIFSAGIAFLFAFFIFYFCKDSFKHLKFIAATSFLPLFVVTVLTVYNCFTKEVFFISDTGVYTRNKQFFIDLIYSMHFVYYIICILASLYSYFSATRKNQHISKSVIFFSVFPILGSMLQYRDVWQPFLSIGYFLACLLIYSFENSYSYGMLVINSVNSKMKNILDECTELLSRESIPEENISQLLQMLVKYYNSEDAFISVIDDKKFKAEQTYNWNVSYPARMVVEEINKLSSDIFYDWYNQVESKGEVFVRDTSSLYIKESFSKFCKNAGIKNCMSVPILNSSKIIAVITVYNFDISNNDHTMLRTISYFALSEILKRKTMDKAEKERKSIISALSQGYECIYYINLDEDKITLYRHDEKVEHFFDIHENETVPFSSSYKLYVESVVLPEEQEELLEFGSVDVLRSVLRDRKSVTKKFKSNITESPETYEAKWVKVEPEDEEPHHVVLGYTNIESKIQQRLLEEKEREIVKSQLDSAIEVAEEIVHKSQFDKLTGVYNKVSGLDIMSKYLSAKNQEDCYAFLFFDLDNFKEINDTYGHLEGDDILAGVGKAIKDNCRPGDIAVRFGGDEFIILLKNIVEEKDAENIASKISEQINKLATGKFYYTTCSIGGYISDSRDLQRVMENADKVLYEVKNKGRDGIIITKEQI